MRKGLNLSTIMLAEKPGKGHSMRTMTLLAKALGYSGDFSAADGGGRHLFERIVKLPETDYQEPKREIPLDWQ